MLGQIIVFLEIYRLKQNASSISGEAMDAELSQTPRMREKINLFSCGSDGSNDSIAVSEFTEKET